MAERGNFAMRLELANSGLVLSKSLPKRMPKKPLGTAASKTTPFVCSRGIPNKSAMPRQKAGWRRFLPTTVSQTVQFGMKRWAGTARMAGNEQGGALGRVAQNHQALIEKGGQLEASDGKQNAQHGRPKTGRFRDFHTALRMRSARQLIGRIGSALEDG